MLRVLYGEEMPSKRWYERQVTRVTGDYSAVETFVSIIKHGIAQHRERRIYNGRNISLLPYIEEKKHLKS